MLYFILFWTVVFLWSLLMVCILTFCCYTTGHAIEGLKWSQTCWKSWLPFPLVVVSCCLTYVLFVHCWNKLRAADLLFWFFFNICQYLHESCITYSLRNGYCSLLNSVRSSVFFYIIFIWSLMMVVSLATILHILILYKLIITYYDMFRIIHICRINM